MKALTISLLVDPSICDDCVKSWKLALAMSLSTAVVCMCGRGGVKRGLNVLAHPSVRNAKLKEKKRIEFQHLFNLKIPLKLFLEKNAY